MTNPPPPNSQQGAPIVVAPAPQQAIPASIVVYEGLRQFPSLLAEVIVCILLLHDKISAELGVTAILGIIAGQLYPKSNSQTNLLGR